MPPKRKNKNKANGFYMYMLERKHEFEAQEGRNLSMADLVPLAHPGWKAVPEDLKQQYNARAKQHEKGKKSDSKNEMSGKLDCTGLYVTDRIDGVAQTKARRHAEYTALMGSWPEGNGVCMEKFYIVSFESQCELKDGAHIPLEVACVEYSLCSGITNELHMFIDPGPIPMGFRYICKARSESRHNIPIEHFEQATSNYLDVFNRLCNFLNPNKQRVFPPMYCEFDKRPEVEGCLRWLCDRAGVYNVLSKVYEMEVLFNCLHEHAGNPRPSHSQARDALLTSAFDYQRGTRCSFHEEMETSMDFCALGKSKKNCYVLSDSLATAYDIIPSAKHLPPAQGTPAFNFIPHNQIAPMRGPRRPVTMENRYDNYNMKPKQRPRSPERQMQRPPEPQPVQKVEPKPEPQMRRPASLGKSGKIASGGMAPMRALEMGAGRGAPIQHSSTNGKYALPLSAPPPSALPPPKASWQGEPNATPQGMRGASPEENTTEQLGASAAASNSLSSDLAARCTLSGGLMPKGIGRGIGRGISRSTLYNGQ